MPPDHDDTELDGLKARMWEGSEQRTLMLLVGASPLPNAIAALALVPTDVVFICTEQTEVGLGRLEKLLKRRVNRLRAHRFRLSHPHKPQAIRDELQGCCPPGGWESSVLFYAGGTKPMGVHTYQVWTERGGRPERACYLSDREAILRFDAGGVELDVLTPDATALTFEELATLHELEDLGTQPPGLDARRPDPTEADAEAILKAITADPSQASALAADGADPAGVVSPLPCSADMAALQPNTRDRWKRFLRKSEWLEIVLSRLVERASAELVPERPGLRETCRDVRGKLLGRHSRPDRDFQLDVAHRIGSRVFAISCTTGGASATPGELGHSKLKIFEVEVRARQIGGDLARCAVVTLHNRTDRDDLRNDLRHRWLGDVPVPEVFGWDDVRAWATGDLRTLKDFLRS